MPTELPTTTFAVLGLLSFRPLSGYETVHFAEESIAHFWTIAKSQVYKELARLEDLGFVKGTDVRQERRPDKRTYRITPEGKKALIDWLHTSSSERDRIRSKFLVKVFFGHLLERERLEELIRDHGRRAHESLEEFRPATAHLGSNPDTVYMYSTALLGIRMLETISKWSADVLPVLRKASAKRRKAG